MNPDDNGFVDTLLNGEENPNYRMDMLDYSNAELGSKGFKNTLYSSVLNKDNRMFQFEDLNMLCRQYHSIDYENDPIKDLLYSNKFILSQRGFSEIPIGYREVLTSNNLQALENDNVLPISYVSYDNISNEDYEKLSSVERNNVFTKYSVVENGNKVYESSLLPSNLDYTSIQKDDTLSFEQLDNGNVKVKSNGGGNVVLNLSQPITNNILLIDFLVENVATIEEHGVSITINGQNNTRTSEGGVFAIYDNRFGYKINSNQPISSLTISFSHGEYELTNIKSNLINYDNLVNRVNSVTPLTLNSINQNKLVLDGNVDVKEDGYFITSIPWQDDAFSVYIDGQKVETEKVNTAFVGAKITKGNHNIVVKYEMPGKKVGIIVSSITIIGIIISPFITKIYRQKKQLSK